jgi:hypothetical protein
MVECFKNFQLVELIVNAVGNNLQIYFQQQPQLQSTTGSQNVWIKGIETFSNGALTNSPITTANAVATPADIANATLTIVESGTENKKQIPLARLNRSFASATGFVPFPPPLFRFKNLYTVDWTKCYLTMVVASVTPLPFSYLFGVYYDYAPDAYDQY